MEFGATSWVGLYQAQENPLRRAPRRQSEVEEGDSEAAPGSETSQERPVWVLWARLAVSSFVATCGRGHRRSESPVC